MSARPVPFSSDSRIVVRTYSPKPNEVERAWHVVDADGAVLGRMATEIAILLRGKHKPVYAPHLDLGDHVIVINAAKLDVGARKAAAKRYYRHSGYPGSLRSDPLERMLERHPDRVVKLAVRGMLPKGPLGRAMLKKLRVYRGAAHPHAAQRPQPRPLSSRRPH